MSDWFREYFTRDYISRYGRLTSAELGEAEVREVISLLGLRPPAKILDLACGFGRHAIPLAMEGFDVTGYDLSAELLREAEGRAREAGVELTLIRGDMRELPFEDDFDVAISLFTSFGFFEDEEENELVLRLVYRSLRPGGRFLLDVVNRDYLIRNFQPRLWAEAAEGFTLNRNQLDILRSRVNTRQTHVMPDGKSKTYDASLRVYSPHEIADLLTRAGYSVEHMLGGLDGTPLRVESPRVVAVGRK